MIKIENKQTSILKEIGKVETNKYSDLLLAILKGIKTNGFTLEEQRVGIRLMDKLEKAGDFFEIKNDELKFIKNELKDFRSTILNKELLEFQEYFLSLK